MSSIRVCHDKCPCGDVSREEHVGMSGMPVSDAFHEGEVSGE